MQFSESWLRTFVNPELDTEALSHQLTMAGLEVEEVRPVAPPFDKIVVAQVLSVTKHPDADRLNVCQVDVGGVTPLQIVCGAPNVREGIKVPCALVGAVLPPAESGGKPLQIKLGKLRGVESQGMLCSARELKLSEEHGGLLLLPEDASVGMCIRQYLDLDDHIFVIKLTPNKADCLSVYGVAREVAALTGAPLRQLESQAAAAVLQEVVPVTISAPDLCGRFAGRVIRGVNAKAPTPDWMVRRLERAGQRSISALVDISNYVMLESGQPSHVFDLDKIQGPLEIRWARQGETLTLLNGNTVTLDEKIGVLAAGPSVESLAGIMGGEATAVSLETQNLYLEAAFWWPQAIQGRARRYNFSTDAAHRFERGVDFSVTVTQLERITQLILDICGGQAGPVDDRIVNVPQRAAVRMRVSRAARIIGVPISSTDIAQIFIRLGLPFNQEEDVFLVTPPSYRFDLEIEEDLIEEVARIYGFERIPAHPPVAVQAIRAQKEGVRSVHTIRHMLAARDYQEVVNFGFVEDGWETDLAGNTQAIRLLNPIASQMAVMRSSLFGSLLANVCYNLNRKAGRVRVFEIGRVFLRDADMVASGLDVAGYRQPQMVGAIAYGPVAEEQWGVTSKAVDFFDVKGDVQALLGAIDARFIKATHPALHPGRSAKIVVQDRLVGWMGELHPQWQQKYALPQAPIMFEVELETVRQVGLPVYAEISRFPQVTRDIALVVKQTVAVQDLQDAMHAACRVSDAGRIVQSIVLFDEFRPKTGASSLAIDEKSLAFRITMQDTGATLQDDVVDAAVKQLLAVVSTKFLARLR